MIDMEPDWPFEPVPAHVRLGELLAMQVLMGVCLAATVLRSRGVYYFVGNWVVGFVNSACVSFLVLVLRDARMGARARFAPSGRFALGLSGAVGAAVLVELWFTIAIDSWAPAYVCALLALVPCSVVAGVRNVAVSRDVRPVWSWVPLTCAVAQIGCVFAV